jgi:predicted O-linked N-acetylglucosamine transferase (SPINDLY family)
MLTNLGHPEWIADSAEAYVAKASALAADLPLLAATRASLREKMRSSVLMDAPRFARQIENCYRIAWQAWCGERAGTPLATPDA